MHHQKFIATLWLACWLIAAASNADDSISNGAKEIDRLLELSWDREGISPVGRSTDAEFCQRVWLDLAGVAPTVSQVRRFLMDPGDHKRDRLIDRLLTSSRHANHMANRWSKILLPPGDQNPFQQQENVTALQLWLRNQFRENTPYDHFVGRFLTAGGVGNRGPAIFYTSRSLEPKKVAAATSQVFLGIQLQCAECHDHPFDHWTQEDFWQYTAFFSQLQQSNARMGQQAIIEDRVGLEVRFPDSDKIATPQYPGASVPPEEDPQGMRRRQLTIWLASRDNPYFARAAVNRVWEHLFGRGLVDPVDAMDQANKPSHPELLDFLSRYFVQQRFDLRKLYATVARTKAYQRTSLVEDQTSIPEASFAAMSVKTLTAAQYYDSLQQNVFRNTTPSSDQSRYQFVNRMRSSDRSARDYPHGVVQVLGLMNGPEVGLATDVNQVGLLASLEAPFLSDSDRIDTLFLATLSRFPTDQESQEFAMYVESAADHKAKLVALADLLWVLLNTAECTVSP